MENKRIEQVINDYCVMSSGANCIIKITSREQIENENAELVRFEFGEYDESCVAVVYEDGNVFTPVDWCQTIWDKANFQIDDIDWISSEGQRAVNLNGMPRIF